MIANVLNFAAPIMQKRQQDVMNALAQMPSLIAPTQNALAGPAGAPSDWQNAIASIESAGSGGYSAVGPTTAKGNKAYGKYQVMDFNIGPWTEKWYGRRLTPEEFLADPAAQDAVFNGEFGSYVQRYGNPQDAASVWFSGRPLSGNTSSDGYTSVPDYVSRFTNALRG